MVSAFCFVRQTGSRHADAEVVEAAASNAAVGRTDGPDLVTCKNAKQTEREISC